MLYKYTNEEEIARTDPQRHKELSEYARGLQDKEPRLYKIYKERLCLVCNQLRHNPRSRYCNKHYTMYSEKQKVDLRNGRARRPNYAYSEPGFNEGMNAYVQDKEHYKELASRFKINENLVNY